ncbi:hypothetical protein [Longimicrobium sp.]|uniref:hypothetical protein n=1 Tax=Longimicrobium sp. TaxID=2029185 RepID=UPI002E3619AE|nr:hypothetical protein [Longimicrobium sp.]HEX6037456.1 hypothetical protein [Longimicrobium sp.]
MKRLIPALFVVLAAGGYGAATAAPAAPAPPAESVAPAQALSVFIGGLRRINSSAWCTWEANVSGGTPPYSYSWSSVGGGGSAFGETWYGNFPVSGSVSVVVTDALGATGSATANVASIYNGPLCP